MLHAGGILREGLFLSMRRSYDGILRHYAVRRSLEALAGCFPLSLWRRVQGGDYFFDPRTIFPFVAGHLVARHLSTPPVERGSFMGMARIRKALESPPGPLIAQLSLVS